MPPAAVDSRTVTVFGMSQSLVVKVIAGGENVTRPSLDNGVTVTSPVGCVASTSVYVSLSSRATLMVLEETLTPAPSSSMMYTVLSEGLPRVTPGGSVPNLNPTRSPFSSCWSCVAVNMSLLNISPLVNVTSSGKLKSPRPTPPSYVFQIGMVNVRSGSLFR